MHTKPKQTDAIRRHLLKHNSITAIEALREYGCFRLAARIHELGKQGFSTVPVWVSKGDKRYVRYVMG